MKENPQRNGLGSSTEKLEEIGFVYGDLSAACSAVYRALSAIYILLYMDEM